MRHDWTRPLLTAIATLLLSPAAPAQTALMRPVDLVDAVPLLTEGGHLVAWKGEAEPESERVIAENMDRLAMELIRDEVVVPFKGSRERRLYVLAKTGPTPEGLPRRAGMARKRPLGGR